jgi:hypothetical protein
MISWLFNQILWLLGVILLLIVVAGVLAPLESLGWWAGWGGKKKALRDLEELDSEKPTPDLPPSAEMELYVLYLSGIGIASADGLANDELDFINSLQEGLPGLKVITDVFPYSVNNNPLTGERVLSPLWKKLRKLQVTNPESWAATVLVLVRNMLQVAVSSDPRYGPIYSLGVAEEIARSLANHGYRLGSHKPVYLLGYSGGGQVSVGSATYLTVMMEAPVHIISVGGVISDDAGISQVAKLNHYYGTKDPIQSLGQILWSGRWSIMKQSDWNKAMARGKITMTSLGGMTHLLSGSYFDLKTKFPDGKSYCKTTADAVKDAILANRS